MFSVKTLRIGAGCVLSACLVFSQPAARRLLKLEDMHRFRDVRDAQISPRSIARHPRLAVMT